MILTKTATPRMDEAGSATGPLGADSSGVETTRFETVTRPIKREKNFVEMARKTKEFVEFLKAACERFGKILMITDGAPQHRSKFVREEIGRLGGVELQFLPPGCPDLNAIEEVWRRMKHAVLDVPYVRFSSMCGGIDKWLRSSLPKLDIEKYLYRKA